MSLLEVRGLTKKFGGLVAVDNFDLTLEEGSILGLIGPNGAGKSTAFNCIAGFYPPTAGSIRYRGEEITGLKPYDICRKGIARTFQLVKPFATKTVLKNVMVGSFLWEHDRVAAERHALEVLEFAGLIHKKDDLGKNLTIPERKRLELARALATRPKLLLLDEVLAGLTPTEVEEMVETIRQINGDGVTILIIEHIMRAIMSLSETVVVIHNGRKIAEGRPEEVASNQDVIKAYLGEKYVLSRNQRH